MQGVQIGWGVLAFAFFQVATCGSRVFGEPISDWNRSLWIHVGKNGGMNGVQIGWKFLRSASLQRQMCIGRRFWDCLSQIGVRLTMAHSLYRHE